MVKIMKPNPVRTLVQDALVKHHSVYCKRSRRDPALVGFNDSGFKLYLEKVESPEENLSSQQKPEKLSFDDNLTRLAPDWERRRKLGNVRMKTFLKLYLSKWFWRGLEWQEIEFVLELLERLKDKNLSFLQEHNEILRRKGINVVLEMYKEDLKKSFDSRGQEIAEINEILPYILSEQDYLALWKLGSVQSLRDLLFQVVTGHEHEGKKGITKARIRGYRDGKGSLRDSNRIKMALEVDRLFYEQEYEQRWQEIEEVYQRLSRT